jgi:hypothetical protein
VGDAVDDGKGGLTRTTNEVVADLLEGWSAGLERTTEHRKKVLV